MPLKRLGQFRIGFALGESRIDRRAFDLALEIGAEALLDRSWASSYYDHLERLSRGGAAERIIGIENICQSESVRD